MISNLKLAQIIKKSYIITIFLLLYNNSIVNADCFIAKENNHIIHHQGFCPKDYKLLLNMNVDNNLLKQNDNFLLKNLPFILDDTNYFPYTDIRKQINNLEIVQPFTIEQIQYYLFKNFRSLKDSKKSKFLSQNFENNILCSEDFMNGWRLYGKTIQSISSSNTSYQAGWYYGWMEKGMRKITFANYIEDKQKFRSLASKRTKWKAKEYLRSLIIDEYSYDDLINIVPNIFVKSIEEVIHKVFSRTSIKNIRIKQIFGGLSNSKLYQITIDNKKYVLRLLDANRAIEARQSEIDAHTIGTKLNIAPSLIAVDKFSLVVLMDFVDGRTMSRDDINNELIINRVIESIKKFHNYKIKNNLLNKTKMDTIEEAYTNYIKKGSLYPNSYNNLFQKLQKKFFNFNRLYLPSHGDLNPANILITKDGNIYFIDWSEARIDNPLLDIGWLACCLELNNEQTRELLKKYLAKDPTIAEFKEVLYFKNLTNFLVATLLIGEQEEKNQNKLDSILQEVTKKSADPNNESITTQEILSKKGFDFTNYALSWLKEFIENQSYNELIYDN